MTTSRATPSLMVFLCLIATSVVAGYSPLSQAQAFLSPWTPRWFLAQLPDDFDVAGTVPDGGLRLQILAAVGRDDLLAISDPSRANICDLRAATAGSVPSQVIEMAQTSQVVIINEAHDFPWHRRFTRELLQPLWEQGFKYFAAEAFAEQIDDYPEEAFARKNAGLYASEPEFGRLIREAKRLGYQLIPYESTSDLTSMDSALERAIRREEDQTNNLIDRVVSRDPEAKMLVHVGYSHAAEVPIPSALDSGGDLAWLAARLKSQTGIDPFTIDQTYCRSSGNELRLAGSTDQLPANAFDLAIAYPAVELQDGRAVWRLTDGMRLVDLPDDAIPESGRVIVEARYSDEPAYTVAVDRLLLQAGERMPLVLPSGEFRLSVFRLDEENPREFEMTVD